MTKKETLSKYKEFRRLYKGTASEKEFGEMFDVMAEALELQIAKKPMVDVVEWMSQPVDCQCPTCGRYVSRYDAWARATLKEHHCECGQAIDWSENND